MLPALSRNYVQKNYVRFGKLGQTKVTTVTSIDRGILGEDAIAVCRLARANLLAPIVTGTQIPTQYIEKEAAGTTMT